MSTAAPPAAPTGRRRPRVRREEKAIPPSSSALVAGVGKDQAERLARVFASLGLETIAAESYEETLVRLQETSFALWALDAGALRLNESIVWASLRFAAEGAAGLGRILTVPRDALRTPVIVLVQGDDALSLRALNAAACAPSITGWNREGWMLGVQDMPCDDEDLAALARALLAEAATPVPS